MNLSGCLSSNENLHIMTNMSLHFIYYGAHIWNMDNKITTIYTLIIATLPVVVALFNTYNSRVLQQTNGAAISNNTTSNNRTTGRLIIRVGLFHAYGI